MYEFHIAVHARGPDVTPGAEIELDGRKFRTLQVPHEALAEPLGVSFEDASDALAGLPRMFIEPDGSLVWTGEADSQKWQVDGVLSDRRGRLLVVELKGTCPAEEFDRLLTAISGPGQPRMFQLVRQAVFLDEAEFRRFAERGH